MGRATPEQDSVLPITRVVFGVRYERQYRVRDTIGALIDAVLRSPGTPFGPEAFPISQVLPAALGVVYSSPSSKVYTQWIGLAQ